MLSLFAACALADVGSSPPAVSVVKNMAFADVEQRTRYFPVNTPHLLSFFCCKKS